MTTKVLNIKISEVENKISGTSSLVTATVFNTRIGKVENNISDYGKYITTNQFNKLTSGNFAARSKQVGLVSKNDFDNKLIGFNRKNTSRKTKYL